MTDDAMTLDFETRSEIDLAACGVYVYAQHPSTDVWCCAYAFGDGEIKVWRNGDPCPPEIEEHVARGGIIRAFNANFEIQIWQDIMTPRYGWPAPKLEQFRCTMVAGMAMSLPGSLKQMGAALGLDTGKLDEEHRQMLQMSRPRRPRKGETPGLYWWDDEARIERLCRICANDVRSERDVLKRVLALREREQQLWFLDQKINGRGIYIDEELCENALSIVDTATGWLNEELREVTGGAVATATNVGALSGWLSERGVPTESLDKAAVDDLLLRNDLPPDVRRALEIRKEGAKAAVKKINAMLAGRSPDGRARGLLQFHAASTGRWGGRRVQPQNFTRGSGADPDELIESVMTGSAEMVRILHDEPLRAVSDCLRGMMRAAPGNRFMVADFSNIEGRVIAWLAGEEWKLQAFRDYDAGRGHDIYHLTAGKILGKDPGSITKDERQSSGKVPELALGFQGGVGAFQKMAAIYRVQMTDERAEEIKQAWRDEHPNVVRYWYDLERAAKSAIMNRGQVFHADRVAFRCAGSFLFMRLPSGRSIIYPYPEVRDKETPWGEMRKQVSYMAVDTYTRKWSRQFAHGGLLFNNAVQGTARDVEADAMFRVEAAGYPIVLTVHDEVVSEVPVDFGDVSRYESFMSSNSEWNIGLPIAAKVWTGPRYRKD